MLLKIAILASSSALHSCNFALFPATLFSHINIKQVDRSQTAGSSQDSEVRKLRMVMSLIVMLSNWLVRQERRGVATSRLCGHDRIVCLAGHHRRCSMELETFHTCAVVLLLVGDFDQL